MIESIKNTMKRLCFPFVNGYLKRRYSLVSQKININGPAFVFCSYKSKLDPLIVSNFIKQNIHLVVDKTLSFGIIDKLKSCFGLICANSVEPDIGSIRKISKVIQNNGIVVFFPFEQPNQNARLKPVYSKLIKKYKLPSFITTIVGSEFVLPYWGKSKNFMPIEIKIVDSFDKNFIQNSTIDSIGSRLESGLSIKNTTDCVRYVGKCPAENIEKFLFTCPECGALCTIKSKKDRFWCSACGDNNTFLPNGTILSSHFKNINDWRALQDEYVYEIIKRRTETDEVILHDIGWHVKNLFNRKNSMFGGFFETFLFPNRLLIANKKFRKEIPIDDIIEIKFNIKNKLIIYAKQNIKLALTPTNCISSEKYCIFIDKLKSMIS